MATSYTSLLGFALPVTGELQGTWGDTVNNSITQLAEDSIAGVATASVAAGNWTLSTTGSGATNEARKAILIPTGSPGVSRNIICPSTSKAYIVVNQSNAAVVVKGAATSGVPVPAGMTMLVAWNGSDFVQVSPVSVDASGNLGIGTSSPGAKLEVSGASNAAQFWLRSTDTTSAKLRAYVNGAESGVIGFLNGGGQFFETAGTERMRLDASGNLGLGTSSPVNKLVVSNAGAAGFEFDPVNGIMQTYNRSGAAYTSAKIYALSFEIRTGASPTQAMVLDASGNLLVTSPAGLGYGTGSGGTVTQATSKSTAVTLNKPTGQITMNNAALAAGVSVSFTLNNSLLSLYDIVFACAFGSDNYRVEVSSVTTGNTAIRVTNITGGSLSEALIINFAIIKGATS